jgi:hypothetical protein
LVRATRPFPQLTCGGGPFAACGLSEQVAAGLFEPFATAKAAGMGVGLVISRTIIEAHGGRLTASGNADRGATFSFSLPLAARTARDAAGSSAEPPPAQAFAPSSSGGEGHKR